MRLTLRTLLAYLDDTLEPGEIKQIGQKVAESDAAQELIARIKQVTRRRRLTTPPDGGPGERFDANVVAEYLDNELSSEQVAELEKLCLESDVHLSEIAASHQILTLVLGEPALIPPTAKRRMMALVHGRKPKVATTVRKGTAAGLADGPSTSEGDETLLIGLPLFRKAPWLRWAIPLTAVLLLAILGGVLWKNLSGDEGGRVAANRRADEPPRDKNGDKPVSQDARKDKTEVPVKDATVKDKDKDKAADKDKKEDSKKDTAAKDKDKLAGKDKDKAAPKDKLGEPAAVKPIPPPLPKPNRERHEAGKFTSRGEILVSRAKPDANWQRVAFNGPVSTGDTLVSLPGYKSEIETQKGVRLLLWGNQPEFYHWPLLESAVTLHHNPDADLELTLHRGRVYFTNRKDKGPARIRLRFWREEVWDITLDDPDSTVGVELISNYPAELKVRDGEEPEVAVFLYVARGPAELKAGYATYGDLKAPPGRCLVFWNNKRKGLEGPAFEQAPVRAWDPNLPPPKTDEVKNLLTAQEELAGLLVKPGEKLDLKLMEFADDRRPERRRLGVRCLGAIDAIPALLDALGDERVERADVRQEALFTLRNWLCRGAEQAPRLYDRKTETGYLRDKKIPKDACETILDLLYGIPTEARRQPETYDALIAYLRHERLEIRELAIRHLAFLVPEGARKIPYNPAGDTEQRDAAFAAWKKLIPNGKLPPPPPKVPDKK